MSYALYVISKTIKFSRKKLNKLQNLFIGSTLGEFLPILCGAINVVRHREGESVVRREGGREGGREQHVSSCPVGISFLD